MNDIKLDIKYIEKNPFKFASDSSVEDLSKAVTYFHNVYHADDEGIISDDIFDILKEVLEERDPKNIYFTKVGAISKDKVELPYYMGSMDKIKPDDQTKGSGKTALQRWINKYDGPYFLSDKLDGVSCLLQCKKKSSKFEKKLYTRGDGKKGQDISYLAKYLKLPECIDEITVRGELIMKKSVFDEKYKNKYSNSRNLVAGQVNSKHFDKKIMKDIDFVVYEVLDPRDKPSKQMKLAKKNNFNVVSHSIMDLIDKNILSEYLTKRREKSDYLIDGIVILDDNKHSINESKNPKWGFAFKMVLSDQGGDAVVLDIEWNASKHGIMKPVLWIGDHSGKPLEIGGVKIKRVTAFNAAYIRDNILGPGSIVHVIRSGDVIPYITEVIKKSSEPKLPEGVEGTDWIWNKSGIDIELLNTNTNKDVVIKKIISFFKKLEVANVGEGTINKLYNNNYQNINSIVCASIDDFKNIDGIELTLAKKIHKNIHDALDRMCLSELIAASTIFGIGYGQKRVQPILDILREKNILEKTFNLKMNNDELILIISEIEGFQVKTASGFVNKLDDFQTFIENNPALKINDLIVKETKSKCKKSDKKLSYLDGIHIVFTGFRDKNLEKEIIESGGVISSTVSKKTTYLVCKDLESGSSKIDKAKKDGVTVLDLDGILKILDEKKKKIVEVENKKKDSEPIQIVKKKIKEEDNIIVGKNLSSSLKDYFVIFTGFRDKALEKVIIINGGTVANSMSKYITAVIAADKDSKSSKIKKAKELNIPIYDRDEFEKLIKKNIEKVLLKNNDDVENYLNNESNSKENIIILNKTKKKKKSKKEKSIENLYLDHKYDSMPNYKSDNIESNDEKKKHILLTNHNNNVEKIIEKKQWTLGKKFCKNVDLLVVTKNDPKKKLDQAKKRKIDFISSDEFKSKYDDNFDKTNSLKIKKSKKKPNKILLTNNSRDNLKNLAESKGISVGKTFGKTVDLLVLSKKDPKKKLQKAIEKKIPIIEDTSFIDEYKN